MLLPSARLAPCVESTISGQCMCPPSRWRSLRRGPLRSIRGLEHFCSLLLFPCGGSSRAAPSFRRRVPARALHMLDIFNERLVGGTGRRDFEWP